MSTSDLLRYNLQCPWREQSLARSGCASQVPPHAIHVVAGRPGQGGLAVENAECGVFPGRRGSASKEPI